MRGKPSPRSQAKSLHESPLQAVPILSALLACPLPLLRAQAPPATPAIISTFLIAIYFLTLLYSDYIFEPTIEQ